MKTGRKSFVVVALFLCAQTSCVYGMSPEDGGIVYIADIKGKGPARDYYVSSREEPDLDPYCDPYSKATLNLEADGTKNYPENISVYLEDMGFSEERAKRVCELLRFINKEAYDAYHAMRSGQPSTSQEGLQDDLRDLERKALRVAVRDAEKDNRELHERLQAEKKHAAVVFLGMAAPTIIVGVVFSCLILDGYFGFRKCHESMMEKTTVLIHSLWQCMSQ